MAQINTSAINYGLTRPELSNALMQGYQQSQAFGQEMAQKQLQNQALTQELESQAAMQKALSGGMAITDPRLLQFRKPGMEVFKTGIAAQKSNIETLQKRVALVGQYASVFKDNPDPAQFNAALQKMLNDGVITAAELQDALTRTENDPEKIRQYATQKFQESIDADKQLSKYFSQDVGGAYQIVAVNPVTGKPEVVSRTGKSLTPGQALEERRRAEQDAQLRQILGGGAAPANAMVTAPVGAPVNRMITPPATATAGAPIAAPVAPTAAPAPSAADVEGASTSTISDTTAVSNVDKVISQITQLRSAAMMGNTRAGEAADQLEKQLNLLYPKLTPEIQNFNFARQQGFQGSFTDWAKDRAPTLTEITDPTNPKQTLRVNARDYKGGGVGSPGVLGVVKTGNLTAQQEAKLKNEIAKDYKSVENGIAMTNDLLESIDAVRSSNLDIATGPISGRTPSLREEALIADTRIENLKGKITALGKAAAAMTGSIGAIANQEWKILADQIAVVESTKGKKAVLEQIQRLEDMAKGTANRLRDAYKRQYGDYADIAPDFMDVPDVSYQPGKYTTKGVNPDYKPSAPKGDAGGPKRVQSDKDYDALKSGETFIAPDGTLRRKP